MLIEVISIISNQAVYLTNSWTQCVELNTVWHKMKVDNAVEDMGEAGKAAGGVTFEWLKQVGN